MDTGWGCWSMPLCTEHARLAWPQRSNAEEICQIPGSVKACIGLRDSCIHCPERLISVNVCDIVVVLSSALLPLHQDRRRMNLHLQTTAGICKAHLHTCSFGLSRRLFGRQHSRTFSCASSQTYTCLHQSAKLKSSFFAPLPTLQGQGCSQHRCFR